MGVNMVKDIMCLGNNPMMCDFIKNDLKFQNILLFLTSFLGFYVSFVCALLYGFSSVFWAWILMSFASK
jgi:hypothetical protein